MLFLVTPATVSNPRVLRGGQPPKKILGGLSSVFPRGLMLSPIWWRLALEYPLLRYSFALSPFPVAMLIWPDLALPISGAPLLMFIFINFIEGELLSYSSRERREKVLPEAESARRMDLFRHRARALLTRIAAARDLREGELVLVVEQSAMAPVPPITVISLQWAAEPSPVLDLDTDEQSLVLSQLFGPDLTERDFHKVSLRENLFLHAVSLDARSISAHARMAALARAASPEAAPA